MLPSNFIHHNYKDSALNPATAVREGIQEDEVDQLESPEDLKVYDGSSLLLVDEYNDDSGLSGHTSHAKTSSRSLLQQTTTVISSSTPNTFYTSASPTNDQEYVAAILGALSDAENAVAVMQASELDMLSMMSTLVYTFDQYDSRAQSAFESLISSAVQSASNLTGQITALSMLLQSAMASNNLTVAAATTTSSQAMITTSTFNAATAILASGLTTLKATTQNFSISAEAVRNGLQVPPTLDGSAYQACLDMHAHQPTLYTLKINTFQRCVGAGCRNQVLGGLFLHAVQHNPDEILGTKEGHHLCGSTSFSHLIPSCVINDNQTTQGTSLLDYKYLGGVGNDPVFIPQSTLYNMSLKIANFYNTSINSEEFSSGSGMPYGFFHYPLSISLPGRRGQALGESTDESNQHLQHLEQAELAESSAAASMTTSSLMQALGGVSEHDWNSSCSPTQCNDHPRSISPPVTPADSATHCNNLPEFLPPAEAHHMVLHMIYHETAKLQYMVFETYSAIRQLYHMSSMMYNYINLISAHRAQRSGHSIHDNSSDIVIQWPVFALLAARNIVALQSDVYQHNVHSNQPAGEAGDANLHQGG
ncbi:hypothetical protein CEUSTIGMA_g4524.t1 [Chlamydomonas eustigma]|uniref:Uncharacterized protein n=1 Tax=Chlamydomonas eustigma TaxID=1157962 RepID=A0A250X1X8_9CHLO|nr:hypothetical protein CEUSTIGMA_g4524.t1 [Chlamydomonas eustigma]|eukprot:GAX77078.1 hypothetical protein CEUSTIGMA_g4524.t1 [Chlamydomonas eustigma]